MAWEIIAPLALIIIVSMLAVIVTQFFFILKEFKKTIQKANKVLDDTGVISESVSKPINLLSTMLMGIKGGATIMKLFQNKKSE